ncbi:MAG: pilus assembly protein PilZ, partial [Deltaproteobacteria bacterium]|nr:pilus assembly protein PilZ [Deltaproteobacteria bacterium]
DMSLEHYSRLAHILTHALDPHTYISSDVDMEGLWSFFFRSGFIYPEKYRRIHARRRALEGTYRRLYQESPEIARHFTYQRNGTIYGHMSMLRAYSRSWMIQHHAAVNLSSKRPGFAVLKQIMQYLQDIHRLPSAQTRYVLCYFRPENKFPDRIFGGFARSLDDPRICSLDRFAYLPELPPAPRKRLPEPWRLTEVSPTVLEAVKRFYGERSGGLLPDVLDLSSGEGEALEALYRKAGFERRCSSRALVRGDEIYAVFIVNRSEFGLNLSSFVNNFKIFVLRPDQLPWDVLSCAINGLGVKSELQRMPAMIYPHDYAWNRLSGYDKQYCLWAYDLRYVHRFKDFLHRKYRIDYWK